MQHREIFAPKYLREVGKQFDLQRDVPNLAAVRQYVADWQTSFHNGTIIKQSEIQLQKEFLNTFFAGCLGYRTKIGRHDWELDYEQTTEVDATRADGYLGFFTPTAQKTIAVIELKGATTTNLDAPQNRKNDKRSPVEQAFSYVPKVGPDCRWVIVSNFVEIRLYHAQDQGRYEYFHITQLHEDEQLWRFLFLLHRDHLLPAGQESKLDFWHRQRLEQEQTISIDFYKKFKDTRLRLFEHLRQFNPAKPELLLFEKTQKLLDRLIFVFFCEDKSLLPYDMTRKVKQAARASLDPAEGQTIWQQLKGLFRSIDKGNPPQNINRYNGGLFAHDPELDELQLGDGMAEVLLGLSNFDFDSDLDVNILGHIFEQSISDIEEIKANLAGIVTEKKQGKRKKDGIFYTPEYITRYIVREAVGGWLDDRKRALGCYELPELSDADLASVKMQKGRPQGNAKVERHRAFWTAYREALANIKVLDPACGSGAFLVQVFDYLSAEGQALNDELARLSLGLRSTDDLSRNILTNNIFGVDINPESVEISKLSLWLKTADNQSELTALDRNIRCGNSLIDDPAVAGDLAFDWKAEFADIFQEKGGFDVVVGNPPYGAGLTKIEKQYFDSNYSTTEYNYDTYTFFFEKSLNLLKPDGLLGFITPNTFLVLENGVKLREFLFKKHKMLQILEVFNVFDDAVVEPLVTIIQKNLPDERHRLSSFLTPRKIDTPLSDFNAAEQIVFSQKDLLEKEGLMFNYRASEENRQIASKMANGAKPLSELTKITAGVILYEKGKGNPVQTGETLKEKPYTSFKKIDNDWRPLARGGDVKKYTMDWQGEFVKYGECLAAPRNSENFSKPKVLIRRTDDKLLTVFDDTGFICVKSAHCLQSQITEADEMYFMVLLNSKLLNWYFQFENFHMVGKPLAEVKIAFLERLPIKIGFQKELKELGKSMLALHRELHAHKQQFLTLAQAELGIQNITRNLENWESLDFAAFLAELTKQKISLSLAQKSEWLAHFEQQRARVLSLLADIQTTDRQIDEMVFDLYGLTVEERALVRG